MIQELAGKVAGQENPFSADPMFLRNKNALKTGVDTAQLRARLFHFPFVALLRIAC